MNEKWSELLCKSQFSSELIEKTTTVLEDLGQLDLLESIVIRVENKKDVIKLKNAVKKIKKYCEVGLFNSLMQELDEIVEDNRWISSGRGKYIQAINDWVQPFFKEFRSISEFDDVHIGGHSDKMVVFVTGKVKTAGIYNKLMGYIERKKPPYKVLETIIVPNKK